MHTLTGICLQAMKFTDIMQFTVIGFKPCIGIVMPKHAGVK